MAQVSKRGHKGGCMRIVYSLALFFCLFAFSGFAAACKALSVPGDTDDKSPISHERTEIHIVFSFFGHEPSSWLMRVSAEELLNAREQFNDDKIPREIDVDVIDKDLSTCTEA
jgi:hypothetical protein